jgi:hypothetical protein
MTMVKAVVLFLATAIALVGFGYGAFYHSRFIKAGGQPRFAIVPPELQSEEMHNAYRRMQRGYGAAAVAILAGSFVATIWGPVVI